MKKIVAVFYRNGFRARVGKRGIAHCDDLSNRFVVPSVVGEAHHGACSRILDFFGETVRVHKIGVFHPELT